MTEFFGVTSVCREDIKHQLPELSTEIVDGITDGEMEWIASKMGDAYCDGGGGYWSDLEFFVELLIERRTG